MSTKTINGLHDANGVAISDMSASFTTKAYPVGDNLHLGLMLFWDSLVPTGTLTLEYTTDPIQDGASNGGDSAVKWVPKNVTNVDGSFQEIMYLDANVPITAFRFVYQRLAGNANIDARLTLKRN